MRASIYFFLITIFLGANSSSQAQNPSVAKVWNETLLDVIDWDLPIPTVQSRNLFHISGAMYDAWAVYDEDAVPCFLGHTVNGFYFPFEGVVQPDSASLIAAQEEAISYACYRLILHRYQNSPGAGITQFVIYNLMNEMGHNPNFESTDYLNDGPAALGNYIAEIFIEYGLQDGSNEIGQYANQYYVSQNPALYVENSGNPSLLDPNSWQRVLFSVFVDSDGNEIYGNDTTFMTAEWGDVLPFALGTDELEVLENNGNNFNVYLNAGAPPTIDTTAQSALEDPIKWGHVLNMIWSSMCATADSVDWNISPGAIGGLSVADYPVNYSDYQNFFNLENGGDNSSGHDLNPSTGLPYENQVVRRGDYVRSIVEYWNLTPADRTFIGYWYYTTNDVSANPDFGKQWNGEGPVLSDLEWDVRSYLALGAALHDAAIAAWSNKGYYDHIRPVNLVRWMADKGQSTNELAENYHPAGLPLVDGYIETVLEGDPLAIADSTNIGGIKMLGWFGHDSIDNPATDLAGVGWIMARSWWPYQRATFVQPPWGGYVSGHSALAKAGAEVLSTITGDEYFPGGLAEFACVTNDFLVIEEGPSQDVVLQWATYHDAADQCAISRLWAGTSSPAADIKGRLIGVETAQLVLGKLEECFAQVEPAVAEVVYSAELINDAAAMTGEFTITITFDQVMDQSVYPQVGFPANDPTLNTLTYTGSEWLNEVDYSLTFEVVDANETMTNISLQVFGAKGLDGSAQESWVGVDQFEIDTENPTLIEFQNTEVLLTDESEGVGTFILVLGFDEPMDSESEAVPGFSNEDGSQTLEYMPGGSEWTDSWSYSALFEVVDANEVITDLDFAIDEAKDLAGNTMVYYEATDVVSIEMSNPTLVELIPSDDIIDWQESGTASFSLTANFSEPMDQSAQPEVNFPFENPNIWLTQNAGASMWLNDQSYEAVYDVNTTFESELLDIDVELEDLIDVFGNPQEIMLVEDVFSINTEPVGIVSETAEFWNMQIYPNPVRRGSDLTLLIQGGTKTPIKIRMYAADGRLVLDKMLSVIEAKSTAIQSSEFSIGIYSLQISDGIQTRVIQLEVIN